MCTNKHKVYNKYLGKEILVDCGVCPACQMVKADKISNRIRNHHPVGTTCLFVHLTYAPIHCPYIDISELECDSDFSKDEISYYNVINVYRDSELVNIVGTNDYKLVKGKHILSDYRSIAKAPLYYKPQKDLKDYGRFKKLRGQSDCRKVAVIWYPDLQDFIKRLRIKVKREVTLSKKDFSFFACAEYGTHYQRCHFHLLIWVNTENIPYFKRAIAETWKFALYNLTYDNIEVAKHASSYVATYVNKPSDFPPFFRFFASRRFRERFSHSKDFGFDSRIFATEEILQSVYLGRPLTFNSTSIDSFGQVSKCVLPIPSYVTNRFLPIFKGFRRFSYDEIFEFICKPYTLPRIVWQYRKADKLNNPFYYKNYSFYDTYDSITHKIIRNKYCKLEFLYKSNSEIIDFQRLIYRRAARFNSWYNKYLIRKLYYVPKDIVDSKSYLLGIPKNGFVHPYSTYLYADFVLLLLRSLVSRSWNLQYMEVNKPLDLLNVYENIHETNDENILQILKDNSLFKEDFHPNKQAKCVAFTLKKTERFFKKTKTHSINDMSNFNYNFAYEY